MQSKERVLEQVKALGGFGSFGTKKEINYLPEILRENENIYGLTSGFYDGNTWLIVCTDSRLVFLDKGMIYGLKQVEIPLDKVNSIELKTGMFLADIIVWDGASKVKIENIDKGYAKKFVDIINNTLHFYKNKPIPSANSAVLDLPSQLEKLASLKDKGILTEDEFQEQKKKLLAA